MIARPATPGAWVDTSTPITPHVAAALKAAGKVGVFRYVPLPGNSAKADISGVELGCLLDAGLEVGLVQHVRGEPPKRPLWQPGAHDGVLDAQAAIACAQAAGYPPGCHIFQDLEACDGSSMQVLTYCIDWGRTMLAGGYLCGLYVGYAAVLTPDALYALPSPTSYWSDAGRRQVSTRGCAVQQAGSVDLAGVGFDVDLIAPDALGGLPFVCGVGQPERPTEPELVG